MVKILPFFLSWGPRSSILGLGRGGLGGDCSWLRGDTLRHRRCVQEHQARWESSSVA